MTSNMISDMPSKGFNAAHNNSGKRCRTHVAVCSASGELLHGVVGRQVVFRSELFPLWDAWRSQQKETKDLVVAICVGNVWWVGESKLGGRSDSKYYMGICCILVMFFIIFLRSTHMISVGEKFSWIWLICHIWVISLSCCLRANHIRVKLQ